MMVRNLGTSMEYPMAPSKDENLFAWKDDDLILKKENPMEKLME